MICGGGKWELGGEPPHTCKELHAGRQRLGQASVCRMTQGKCRPERERDKSRGAAIHPEKAVHKWKLPTLAM